ncbi:MAG: hypothetical protein U0694_06555 [Anaerolineae bacterium]
MAIPSSVSPARTVYTMGVGVAEGVEVGSVGVKVVVGVTSKAADGDGEDSCRTVRVTGG